MSSLAGKIASLFKLEMEEDETLEEIVTVSIRVDVEDHLYMIPSVPSHPFTFVELYHQFIVEHPDLQVINVHPELLYGEFTGHRIITAKKETTERLRVPEINVLQKQGNDVLQYIEGFLYYIRAEPINLFVALYDNFRLKHPDLEVISVTPCEPETQYGFYILTKPKSSSVPPWKTTID